MIHEAYTPWIHPCNINYNNDFTGAEILAARNGFMTRYCAGKRYNPTYQRCCISVVFRKRYG